MSTHSYSRCWIHLIWGTLDREKLLNKKAAVRVSRYLTEYAESKSIYMKINYVNADHVNALIDLPTALSIEELVQLVKGSSSHWINSNDLVTGKFALGRRYGAFSVSESNVDQVAQYIAHQKNIIACARSLKNCVNSSIGTGCNGRLRKAVKTADARIRGKHRPQGRC
jgi:putative transposase